MQLALLFFFVLGFSCNASFTQSEGLDSSLCSFGSFLSALDTFVRVAKLPSSLNYTSNGVNIQKVVNDDLQEAYLSGGADAARERFFSICSAKQQMFQQMLPSNLKNCIDATTFLSRGLSASTSYALKKFFERLGYQCGPAFSTYLHNMDRFMFAKVNMTASLKTCSKAFLHGMQTTDETVFCRAMRDYGLCQANVYLIASNNMELAYSVCETTRIGEVVTLPLCSTSDYYCSVELIEQQN
uniref:NAD(P)(+)--arginine ADP-ribosyltransferase n=1 Tax=Steinernema glaseri TaxID=37863 RepID=A0A1I7ZJK3_9BILA